MSNISIWVCWIEFYVEYGCVWDFGFLNWSLRVLGIASIVLISLITNILRVKKKKKNFFGVWDYFLCSELLVYELLLLGVVARSFCEPGYSFFSITLVMRFVFLLAVPPLLCVLRATIVLCSAVVWLHSSHFFVS